MIFFSFSVFAEELEINWDDVNVIYPDSHAKWGLMITGGSWSVNWTFDRNSRIGASARIALIEAGAKMLGAAPNNCTAKNSTVTSDDGRSVTYKEILSKTTIDRTFSEEEMKAIDKLKRETSVKIRDAASHGDLKENAEYHAAREEQSLIVYKKQLIQSHAPFRFIERNEIDTDEVGFGNKVTILEEGKDKAEDYYLLGPIEFELDIYPMIVTYHAPFGQSMVGKKVDEYFTLEIEGKETKIRLKNRLEALKALRQISVDLEEGLLDELLENVKERQRKHKGGSLGF